MALQIFILLTPVPCAFGEQEVDESKYVSREEYEALKKELDEVKSQLSELVKEKREEKAKPEPATIEKKVEALDKRVTAVESAAEGSGLGQTKLLIAGDTTAGFVNQQGQNSTFNADFSPMLLWQLNEYLFFEGGLDIDIAGPDEDGEGSETDVELGAAYLTYLFGDYSLFGAGYFAVPFTAYHNHFDAPWINKLPTDPLIYSDGGIAPDSAVGIFTTGAIPCKRIYQLNYAIWLTNGPALMTDDPSTAGSLNFDNYDDNNNDKAMGFRIGILPVPQLRLGYSFQFSKVSPSGFEEVDSTLHGIDFDYVETIEPIKGIVTARGGWVWSNLSTATYDPTGSLGFGPIRFNNDRNGGYAEIAYRPTKADEQFLRNLEFVLRYDKLNIPSEAPGGGDQEQWGYGLDYWLTDRTVVKTAYINASEDDGDAFWMQIVTGF